MANGTLVNGDPYLTNNMQVAGAQPRNPDISASTNRRERWWGRFKPRACLMRRLKIATKINTSETVPLFGRHGNVQSTVVALTPNVNMDFVFRIKLPRL